MPRTKSSPTTVMRDKAIALAEIEKLLQQDRANEVPNLPARLLAKGVALLAKGQSDDPLCRSCHVAAAL